MPLLAAKLEHFTPAELQKLVLDVIARPETTPADLISLAGRIEKLGHAKTASALREQAAKLAAKAPPSKPAKVTPATGPAAVAASKSPTTVKGEEPGPGIPAVWKDVPADRWTAFVRAMGNRKAKDVDARGKFGMFGIGARRLVDLGLMRNPKKGTVNGQKGVWTAEWVPPHSQEKFLSSPEAQYRTFVASMIDYRRAINQQMQGKGQPAPVNGKRVTLSGLLAVAHHAGMGGLEKWLSGERRVPVTTAAFERATEIF